MAVGFLFPNFTKGKYALVLVPPPGGVPLISELPESGPHCRGWSHGRSRGQSHTLQESPAQGPRGLCRGWGGERWKAARPSDWPGPGVGESGEAAAEPGLRGPGREGRVPARDQLLCPGLLCSSTKTVVNWICVPEDDSWGRFRRSESELGSMGLRRIPGAEARDRVVFPESSSHQWLWGVGARPGRSVGQGTSSRGLGRPQILAGKQGWGFEYRPA